MFIYSVIFYILELVRKTRTRDTYIIPKTQTKFPHKHDFIQGWSDSTFNSNLS